MRIQQVLAVTGAATLSVSAFAGPSIAPSQAASAHTATVQAGMNAAHRLAPDDAQRMKGTFQLDDGRMLVLSATRNRLFAELDGKREELVPIGQNRFVARDSGTRMSFDRVPYAQEVVVDSAR